MKCPYHKTFLIIIIAVLFIRCDNSVESLEKGGCKVNVNGFITKSYSGEAIFENVPSLQGSIFFLLLKDNNLSEEKYCFVEFSGSKPDVGTYNLINIEEDNNNKGKLAGRYNDSENYGSYKSIGGSIEIHYSSDKEIKGKFNFPAYEYVPSSNGEFQRVEIIVSGEFYAEQGYTGIILN